MTASPKALLFDLGGVVLKLHPHLCFEHWAARTGLTAATLAARFRLDDAYKAHETGAIDFPEYARRLSARLDITLSEADWLNGWNALFADTYATVVERLPSVAQALPTYAFTNTNAAHQAAWEKRFGDRLTAFKKIYASWQIGRRKPNVNAFLWVARDMGVAPADILFLDDSNENVAGARAAGLQAMHVRNEAVTRGVMDDVLQGTGAQAEVP